MLSYENRLWKQGYLHIAGIDEVGRGCLCGDVVASAVILPSDFYHEDIRDSKKMTANKREEIFEIIHEHAIAIGIGKVKAQVIDDINIRQASRLAMKLAVEQLALLPDYLLVDAESVSLEIPQMAIIKGDDQSQSIAAASIIAKVTRDRMCLEWDQLYPEYGINKHKGYATARHREMLLEFGPSPIHRKSFLRKLYADQHTLF